MIIAPAFEMPVPFKFRFTFAVGAIPAKSKAAPLLTVTPEVLFVPSPNAPATPSFSVPPVTFVAPV